VYETLDDAARRELQEETGLEIAYLEQLYTFGAIDRDPRERVVSVAWYALVKLGDYRARAASDAKQADWFPVSKHPPLAFDHESILKVACERLRGKVRYQPIGFELLTRKFTLRQLQHLYETILDRELDKRNFRKKILGMGLLEELDEFETDVAHRAARLYRFDKRKYQRLTKQGFNFEI
jgi:8-oxo-dGTP diphosphatase